MNDFTEILGSPVVFLDTIFEDLASFNIDVGNLELDHICYRVENMDQYRDAKSRLRQHGILLSDNEVGGRPITVIRMILPFEYHGRLIHVVELPAPKPGSPYLLGYEHVEFVIETPLDTFKNNHPSIAFDTKGFDKLINRDLRVRLSSGSVKFHENTLEFVIKNLD